MYGDKNVEESFIIALREAFRIPLTCETPVHLSLYDPERRFADQADRDVELACHNYHPMQIMIYDTLNK